jgi:hypothetical protein
MPEGSDTAGLRIVDTTGRILLDRSVNGKANTIDVGLLAPGSYGCVITGAAGMWVERFVKE